MYKKLNVCRSIYICLYKIYFAHSITDFLQYKTLLVEIYKSVGFCWNK